MRLLLSFVLKVASITLLLVSVAGAVARLRAGEWTLLGAQVIGLAIARGLWLLGDRGRRGVNGSAGS